MSVAYHSESYVVTCGNCRHRYDALTAFWCRCVSADVAVACPHCQSCVHKESKTAALEFWVHAPDTLLRMRAGEKHRRRKMAALPQRETKRVLVVDDDEEIRLIAMYALHQMSYDCVTADSPAMALAMLAKEQPAVVLTDALMPGGDGRELCRTIKERYPGVKVVVMTSLYTSARYASEASRVFHSDDYLAKPIDFERLQSVLSRLAPLPILGKR
jgi:CheY-like chemotaxis protein